jgi:predicted TIM-barrel fold metal-dependent hydrolase
MIIDFHAHIFPDALAPKAIRELSYTLDGVYTPVSDGTVSGIINNMNDWNIDISVIQPVVTKQSQVKSVNEWVASICSDRLVGFGGIYPHSGNYKTDIDFVVNLGLKGLKFHAEYQGFTIDDKHMLHIYDYALSKGLILLHHAGYDPSFPPPFKSSPRQFLNVVRAMRGGIIVAAHLGGHDQWDDVENYLAGSEIYLDTSMGFGYFPHDQFLRIEKIHGADKILFASDAPWSNAKTEIETLKTLQLPKEDIDSILGANAKRILKL